MSNAVATITQDIYSTRDSFAQVLTDRSLNFEREAGFAIQVITASDYSTKLALGNRQSVVNAVINIAAIGISLNPAKKQAYLVPREGKICLDISYMGLMDLAMATGSIRWAKAELVYETDQFALNGFDRPPTHTFAPFSKERGDIVGVYVVVKTADGDYLTEAMSIDEVFAIRDRSSAWKAYIKDPAKTCPWVTDEGEMVKKTCVKRAYKYWPKTDRLERAIHYLNTDGGQGIDLSGQPPAVDPALADAWITKAKSAVTEEELTAIWTQGVAALRAAKDMPGYERLKAAVTAQGEILKREPLEGQCA